MEYGAALLKAREKIAQYGMDVTLLLACENGGNAGHAGYDPVAGVNDRELEEVSAKALVTRPDERLVTSGLVSAGDALLLVAGDVFQDADDAAEGEGGPNEGGDVPEGNPSGKVLAGVVIKGARWRIIRMENVAPGGIIVLRKIAARRD